MRSFSAGVLLSLVTKGLCADEQGRLGIFRAELRRGL
jgi:hypothetical protein